MLDTIHVKNLALIDELEIGLGGGLNILTGETGAGKSIIIDSIGVALGEKAAKGFVREGKSEGLVELYFSELPKELSDFLDSKEISTDGSEVILSRKLSQNRSVAKINGEAVNASILKEAAGYLIDIHGQHEHQSLLSESSHLLFLDRFGGEELLKERDEAGELYHEYRRLKEELVATDISEAEKLRETDLLEYEVREIEDAALVDGEDESLGEEYRRLKNYDRIFVCLGEAQDLISGDRGMSELSGLLVRSLSGVYELDKEVSDIHSELVELSELVDQAGRDISSYLNECEFDGERFAFIEARLDLINHLKDKYGGSIEAIKKSCEKKKERLSLLRNHAEHIEDLKKKLDEITGELEKKCSELSERRRSAAEGMKELLVGELLDLNFLDVRFDIEFSGLKDFQATGKDAVRFLISTNPGEPLKELSKVASGGELSRIMLALKSLLADSDSIDTLIFDEIDTGISGETANRVAKKMRDISKKHQVICITHLPQIASAADHHFLIKKGVDDGVTTSNIRELSEEEVIDELSRMIGGDELTDKIRESAAEMKGRW